jgi:TonB family protein
MRRTTIIRGAALAAAALALATAGSQAEERAAQGSLADVRGSLARSPAIAPSGDLDEYKRRFARSVASANSRALADALPPILKSVVVLDITVGADGALERVVVWRSNGYTDLERTALESVRRMGAAPPPPPQTLLGGRSVRFLETFLFRPDGQYQVRSIVGETLAGDRPTLVVETENRM